MRSSNLLHGRVRVKREEIVSGKHGDRVDRGEGPEWTGGREQGTGRWLSPGGLRLERVVTAIGAQPVAPQPCPTFPLQRCAPSQHNLASAAHVPTAQDAPPRVLLPEHPTTPGTQPGTSQPLQSLHVTYPYPTPTCGCTHHTPPYALRAHAPCADANPHPNPHPHPHTPVCMQPPPAAARPTPLPAADANPHPHPHPRPHLRRHVP